MKIRGEIRLPGRVSIYCTACGTRQSSHDNNIMALTIAWYFYIVYLVVKVPLMSLMSW